MKRATLATLLLLAVLTVATTALPSEREAGTKPYRVLSTLSLGIFACSPNPESQVFTSREQLLRELEARAAHCDPQTYRAARAGFLHSLDSAGFDFSREALVIMADWYGSGMAKGQLMIRSPLAGVLEVGVAWKVPSGPLTPDTAVFRQAIAVDRKLVTIVRIDGRTGKKDVRIAPSPESSSSPRE